MLHGRVVRPPRPGARLHELDEQAAAALPGVIHVVRDGSFLAVTAEREEQAVGAREALREAPAGPAATRLPPGRWTSGSSPSRRAPCASPPTAPPTTTRCRRSRRTALRSRCDGHTPRVRAPRLDRTLGRSRLLVRGHPHCVVLVAGHLLAPGHARRGALARSRARSRDPPPGLGLLRPQRRRRRRARRRARRGRDRR